MNRGALIITPRLAVQKGDFLGSGVPYWPLEAAIFAAHLREQGWTVGFLDLFGSDPWRLEAQETLYWQGLPLDVALRRQNRALTDWTTVFVYALSAMSHQEVLRICRHLHDHRARQVVVFENSQAVTGYDLTKAAKDFFAAGADALILGEPYGRWADIEHFLVQGAAKPENVLAATDPKAPCKRNYHNPVIQPIPAWDLVPLAHYWRLPYSHGPKQGPYLPMLTSRGCPYPCTFCVVPATNDRRWRARSAAEVVNEMVTLAHKYGIRDFQWEDLNPTIDRQRMVDIAQGLIASGRPLRFRLVSGTKAETLDAELLRLMAQAGCRYISISPESGSPRVLKAMNKPFNHDHGLEMVRVMTASGIASQACFVLGHPGEEASDRLDTERYAERLVQAGLGEAAFFMLSPLPGSAIAPDPLTTGDYQTALWSFSPKHRRDYAELDAWRRALIRRFLGWKLRYQGLRFLRQAWNALIGQAETKMEMLPWRFIAVTWMRLKS